MLDPIDGFFGKTNENPRRSIGFTPFHQLPLFPGAFIKFFTTRMACRKAIWLKAMVTAVISCLCCLTILLTGLPVEKPDRVKGDIHLFCSGFPTGFCGDVMLCQEPLELP